SDLDTKRRHVCPGKHNGHGCDHQKRHDDLHRILNESHHISHLHVSTVHRIGSVVNDQHGNPVHDQHHAGHHKCHASVYKEVCLRERCIRIFKTLLLMFLPTESTDHQNSGKDLPCHQIQPVDKRLELREFRHGNGKKHTDQHQDQHNSHAQDPGHGRIGLQHPKHASQAEDWRVKNNTEHHRHHQLHL